MSSMVPYGSSLEEIVANRIATKLDRIDQGLFWVFVGRVMNTNKWQVFVGNKGDKGYFLTVTIDRRVTLPLSWDFTFNDGVHENDAFSCPTLVPADVEKASNLMVDYIGMLY